MISPLNITAAGLLGATPPVCGRLPAWASRTSREPWEPLPVWTTQEGFVAPGPMCLEWSGRRWDRVDGESDERPDAPGGTGSCTRIILAQNAYHDGEQIIFGSSYYELAPRPYYLTETAVRGYLLTIGYTEEQLTPPIPDWVAQEVANNYAAEAAIAAGGYLYSRPFVWPTGDTDLCQEHFEPLYSMPYPEPYGDGYVHQADTWPSAKNVPGFYAFRRISGSSSLSSFDRAAILRRAWQGSTNPGYGTRFGTKDDFMRALPPGVAFDIRIRKKILLTKYHYHETEKESQAIYNVIAWRITGSPPA